MKYLLKRAEKSRAEMGQTNILNKKLFFITGLCALIWFLIRVIPKPSRAIYPCQRAAFPIASMFVVWLIEVFTAGFFLKKARVKFRQSNYIQFAGFSLIAAIFAIMVFGHTSVTDLFAANKSTQVKFVPTDMPNTPIGEAIGIFPGRVSWGHNPDAATWNGTSGYWWQDNSTNPEKVSSMLSKTIMNLTGTWSDSDAWDALFKYFNKNHNKGEVGYSSSEKIAVKLNMNMVSKHDQVNNAIFNSPQMVEALLTQLVNKAGVPESQIIIYDISRYIPDIIYDRCKNKFPAVHFIDNSLGEKGREPFQLDPSNQVVWSDIIENGQKAYLPKFVTEATYVINMASLKGHTLTSVTICAKNHFGTFACSPSGDRGPYEAGIHPYVSVKENTDGHERPMGSYNALVDLMGHKDLGGKTLLFLIDALYTTSNQGEYVKNEYKMSLSPFNGNWMASIFASQDGVAIESVGLDFLRCEPGAVSKLVIGNVDNYLHEAALAGNPPSSIFYDPENDGTKLKSLGVHEHWNDALNKQYTRNLQSGEGIELKYIDGTTSATTSIKANINKSDVYLKLYPNPVLTDCNISIDSKYIGDFSIEIINAEGKIIEVFTFCKTNRQFSGNVDLSQLGRGFYTCVFSNNMTRESVKFIKK